MPSPVMRLSKELRDVQLSREPDILLEPLNPSRHNLAALTQTSPGVDRRPHRQASNADTDDLFTWVATIDGPADTPFAGGKYVALLQVPKDYPMAPPTATFLTRVFHPNVCFTTGEICLNILKKEWSPAWTLSAVCRAISALLAYPEANSPLNCDAGNLLRAGDVIGYRCLVRMYAIADAGAPPFVEP